MKLEHHQRRLLQYLLDHPDFLRMATYAAGHAKSRIVDPDGYIDESWRVTEAGKSRLANEEGQQQQQTVTVPLLNQPSQPNINNAATQADLLRRTAFLTTQLPGIFSLTSNRQGVQFTCCSETFDRRQSSPGDMDVTGDV